MFGTIRRHQSWLWGIIIAVMIVSLLYWTDGRSNTDAGNAEGLVISGKKVTPRMMREAANEVRLLYFLNFRKWPEEDTQRAQQINFDLENESMLRLFRVAKAEEAGIHVADETVAALAKRLLGDFPLDRFAKEVLTERGLTADDFERFVRHDAAIQQLGMIVGAAGRMVTPAEAEAIYRRENQALAADIALFPLSNYMSRVTITNGALSNWFSSQQARYRTPDKVVVSYVQFDKTNFFAEAEQRINTVTNLEFQLREAYYRAGTNQFKDTNGNVLPEREALVKIRETETDRLAINLAARAANEFARTVYDMEPHVAANLEKAAQTAGKPVKVSEPFDMGGPTNLLGSERLAAQFADVAFRMNPTNAISFQPLPGEDGIYIIALKESIPGRMQTFEEVKGQVEEDYRRFNAFTLARSDATNFIAQATNAIAGGKSFEEAAKQLNVKTESLPPIAQTTDTLTNLAERLNFRQLKSVLFSLEPGRVSGYIPNPPEGGYVVHVKSKLPFDEAKVKEELPKFLSELRSEKQNEIFNQWFRQQVEKANLPLNRPKTPGQS